MTYQNFEIVRMGFNLNEKIRVSSEKMTGVETYLRGELVKFFKVVGTQISVEHKGRKMWLPLKSVLSFQDKTILSRPTLLDTLFIVSAKNEFYDVGTVIRTSLTSIGSDLCFYGKNNQRIYVAEWLSALNGLANNQKLNTLAERFNQSKLENKHQRSESHVKLLSEPEHSIETIKLNVQAPSPDRNIFDYASKEVTEPFAIFKDHVNTLLNEKGDFVDISGYRHSTLLDCLNRNQLLLDISVAQAVLTTSKTILKEKGNEQ